MQVCSTNTTSDHSPVLGVINVERKENSWGSKTHWNVFNSFLSMTEEFWTAQSEHTDLVVYYAELIAHLESLKARCTVVFPLNRYRPAIPRELREKLSKTRALSFRHMRTGDCALKQTINAQRKENRQELYQIRATHLAEAIKERHSATPAASMFWSRARKKFKPGCSLNALIDEQQQRVKESTEMLRIAADHYEKLFEEHSVYRPHPYIDSPCIEWENDDDPIPLITLPELIKVTRSMKKKQSCDANGISSAMLRFLPTSYLAGLLPLMNRSLQSRVFPPQWK